MFDCNYICGVFHNITQRDVLNQYTDKKFYQNAGVVLLVVVSRAYLPVHLTCLLRGQCFLCDSLKLCSVS